MELAVDRQLNFNFSYSLSLTFTYQEGLTFCLLVFVITEVAIYVQWLYVVAVTLCVCAAT